MPPPLYGQLVHVAPLNFVGRPNSEGGNGYVVGKDHADRSFDMLSDIAWTGRQSQPLPRPLTQPPTPPTSPRGIQHIIIQSRGWSEYDRHPNPLLVHLRNGRLLKPRAWLRIDEGECNKYEKGTKKGEMISHLNELESNKLVRIKSELERIIEKFYRKQWPNGFNPHADLAYAYGVSVKKVRD